MVKIRVVCCECNTPTEVINELGKVPVLGTGIGVGHITYGLGKASLCAVAASFAVLSSGNDQGLNAHSIDGLKYVGRGLVELPPVLGGIVLYVYDFKRKTDLETAPLLSVRIE